MNLRAIGYECVYWIEQAHDRVFHQPNNYHQLFKEYPVVS
jgi:hypothetical protein